MALGLLVAGYLARPALHAPAAVLPGWTACGLSAVAGAAVAGRRRAPILAATTALIASSALVGGRATLEPFLAFLLCAWSAARTRPGWGQLSCVIAGLLAVAGCSALRTGSLVWAAVTALAIIASVLGGRM